jgi:2-keto-3-deoxy-L-arabinonate dehydratase
MMTRLQGIVPMLNTAFTETGELDMYSQEKLIQFALESGAHGIALFGTAGEGYTLAQEEKDCILALARKVVGDKVPIVVSTGATGTRLAVQQSVKSQDDGADVVMVVPPYYLKPDADGVRFYFESISQAVRIPIMIQDNPALTGVPIGAALLAGLCKRTDHVRYIKIEAPPTAPKISRFLGELQGADGYALGGLNGQFLLEEFERGAIGCMPGSDLIDRFVKIWMLFSDGKKAEARRLYNVCLPLLRYELQPALGVSTMKRNLLRQGVLRSDAVRHPTQNVDRYAEREIQELWDAIEHFH